MKSTEKLQKKRGSPLFVKGGASPNPAGRPAGTKNKFPTGLKDKVLHACSALESQGLDLATVAMQKPDWFYENFLKPMLPKNIDFRGDMVSKSLIKVEFVRPDDKPKPSGSDT